MPYAKHNVYWGAYPEGLTYVQLPDAYWVIEYFLGEDEDGGNFHPDIPTDTLCLILEDAMRSFWPVMSFLSREEAIALAGRLLDMATNTRREDHVF